MAVKESHVEGVKDMLRKIKSAGGMIDSVLLSDMKGIAASKASCKENHLAVCNGVRGKGATWTITEAGKRYIA